MLHYIYSIWIMKPVMISVRCVRKCSRPLEFWYHCSFTHVSTSHIMSSTVCVCTSNHYILSRLFIMLENMSVALINFSSAMSLLSMFVILSLSCKYIYSHIYIFYAVVLYCYTCTFLSKIRHLDCEMIVLKYDELSALTNIYGMGIKHVKRMP